MPILYKCSFKGCSKILEVQGYCSIHQARIDKIERARARAYKAKRLMDNEQLRYQSFYKSKQWLDIKDSLIASCYAIDIVEYYRTGKIVQGYTVHHINSLSSYWDSRLDTNNLIYVTESNHQFIHREYNKGDREKNIMIRVLFGLKKKFIIDYK